MGMLRKQIAKHADKGSDLEAKHKKAVEDAATAKARLESCEEVVVKLLRDDTIMWASDFPHERERDQFGGDLPHLKARKDLTDEFRNKMLCDNPVRFYRLGEGDIAAARKAKGI